MSIKERVLQKVRKTYKDAEQVFVAQAFIKGRGWLDMYSHSILSNQLMIKLKMDGVEHLQLAVVQPDGFPAVVFPDYNMKEFADV